MDLEAHHCLTEGTTETRDVSRLRCLLREVACDLLCSLPSKALGICLRRSEFVFMVKYCHSLRVFRSRGE